MKVLVRNPQEKLELLVLQQGGSYYDESRILWRETDGEFPTEYQGELDQHIAEREAEITLLNDKVSAKEYLNSTDWYVIRKIERNIDIPLEISNNRQNALTTLNL
jgi:hypothetical protein